MARVLYFTVVDYVLFGLTLLASGAIGVYFAFKKQSTNEFLTASKGLRLIPTAVSLMASFVSGISLLSHPSEIYTMGVVMCWRTLGTCIALVIVAYVMLPKVYKVKGLSMYKYLEERFDSKVLRFYGSLLFTISTLLWASVALYAPSISLAGVSGLPVWVMILPMGAMCTLYTSIGGLKAVVWTDTFQATLMYGGLIAIIIKGTINIGGISTVMQVASDHGRLQNFFNIDPNPFQNQTLWTALFGGCLIWIGHYGSNQLAQQRYRSMPTLQKAQRSVLLNIPFLLLIYFLIYYLGLIMFAYYSECDPIKSGQVASKDQLTVYFMLDIFSNVYGLPGLMLACICATTLSSVSSGIHALATVSFEDFIKPWAARYFNEFRTRILIKVIACGYGIIITALSFACDAMGGVFATANKALGAMEGPLVGLLLLGMIIPWSNKFGGIVGVIVGSATTSWLFIGAAVTHATFPSLPVSVEGCNHTEKNISMTLLFLHNTTKTTTYTSHSTFKSVYHMSSHMYPIVGMCLVLLIGSIVSAIANLILRVKRRNVVYQAEKLQLDEKS